ncbi:MAG: thermopsin [Thermoplasmataceae archaeon]
MLKRKIVLVIAVFVAFAMVLSSIAIVGGTFVNGSSTHQSTSASSAPGIALSGKAAQIMKDTAQKGIPATAVMLPNFNAPVHKEGGAILPSYLSAPAPMGIGAYGVAPSSSGFTAYNLTTSDIMASLTINNLKDFYALDDGPNSVTFQLNAVLDNVALFGHSNYSMWTQNVVLFSARTNILSFEDNIWNFSSPLTYLTGNAIYSSTGIVYPYTGVHIAIGPAFQVTYPFTLDLYLNTSVVGGRSTVFFNYSLSWGGNYVSGTYDEVIFNSISPNTAYVAPNPQFLISGNTVTPTGFIPYDAEIMIGGPGGGSTANVQAISATMQLEYLSGTSYNPFPNTFDVGSETGETSQGVAVSWNSNDVATLTAGPSYVYGMWGISPAGTQMTTFTGTVNPPNSFMFASPTSSFNQTLASWVPLSSTGQFSFTLPYGILAAEVMLSNYNPQYVTLTGSNVQISLVQNFELGVYTPLYAFGNAQLKYISYPSFGWHNSQYVLYNNPSYTGYLNPLFGMLNDYVFPAFQGILLSDVTAPVLITHAPTFTVNYMDYAPSALIISFFELPSTNDLGIFLYQTSNTVISNNYISGWFSYEQSGFPVANLVLWNSQYNLVENNYFNALDSSMLVYNTASQMGHNYIIGNIFAQSPTLNSTNYAPIAVSPTLTEVASGPVGLSVYSSDNLITGNFFTVYNTALSPDYSIYSGSSVAYRDNWNHNYWWNYVPGTGPYNNFGQITSGYDYHPIVFGYFHQGDQDDNYNMYA